MLPIEWIDRPVASADHVRSLESRAFRCKRMSTAFLQPVEMFATLRARKTLVERLTWRLARILPDGKRPALRTPPSLLLRRRRAGASRCIEIEVLGNQRLGRVAQDPAPRSRCRRCFRSCFRPYCRSPLRSFYLALITFLVLIDEVAATRYERITERSQTPRRTQKLRDGIGRQNVLSNA